MMNLSTQSLGWTGAALAAVAVLASGVSAVPINPDHDFGPGGAQEDGLGSNSSLYTRDGGFAGAAGGADGDGNSDFVPNGVAIPAGASGHTFGVVSSNPLDYPLFQGGGAIDPVAGNLGQVGGALTLSKRTVFTITSFNNAVAAAELGLKSTDATSNAGLGDIQYSGVLVDLAFAGTDLTGALPGVANTTGDLYFVPNANPAEGQSGYGDRPHTPWVDRVLSPNPDVLSGGFGRLDGLGAATAGAGFGGLMLIYGDDALGGVGDATHAAGPGGFSDGDLPGDAMGSIPFADHFPTLSDTGDLDGGDAVLLAALVLTPYFNDGPNALPGVDALRTDGTFFTGSGEPLVPSTPGDGAGAPTTVPDLAPSPVGVVPHVRTGPDGIPGTVDDFQLPKGTVFTEHFDVFGSSSGVAFANFIGGHPDFVSQFELDQFGPGRDLRFDFSGSFDPFPGFGGVQGGGAFRWGQDGVDDLHLQTNNAPTTPPGVVPEPVSAVLGVMGLGVLGVVTRRRTG